MSEDTASPPLDAGVLKEAFMTLSDDALRKEYDASLVASEARLGAGPRPAQVVSLADFSQPDVDVERWTYSCRCGGVYMVDGLQLEDDQHLIGCDLCSEVVWVGYEAEYDDADEGVR